MKTIVALLLAAGALAACGQLPPEVTSEDVENANRAGESVATWKAKKPLREAQKRPAPGAPCSDERFRYLNRIDPDRFMEEFRGCVNAEAARQARLRGAR